MVVPFPQLDSETITHEKRITYIFLKKNTEFRVREKEIKAPTRKAKLV